MVSSAIALDYHAPALGATGAATAKTIQVVTRTIALADLAAFPASATITIKPTDGTLGTDDLLMLNARILYRKKLLTS